ncbi:thioredoxin [Candidatus Poribacteria bacterium]|nr:thioredoxin [Candidatus Poribacteria bacterium]
MPLGELGDLNATNFDREVLHASEPVVVDFWAEWCAPCRAIAPVIGELAQEYQGKLRFRKLNVDENQGLAGRFGVQNIPTLLIFKDGAVAGQIIGMQPKSDIKRHLERHTP